VSPRYLLVVGDNIAAGGESIRVLSARTGLAPAFSNDRIAALVNASCPCIAIGNAGCIVGNLFPRHGLARRIGDLNAGDAVAIADTGGATLPSSFWGGYIAAISGQGSTIILREPSGSFPCYHSSVGNVVVLASDAELLVESGTARVDIDFEEIGRQLYRAFVPVPTTALRGIHELLAGFTLRLPGDLDDQEPCWSPWDHVGNLDECADNAAERLSRIAGQSVQAWASTAPHPLLLSISGGLDSSIVAACLARAGAETICLTMFTEDPSGDERPFARALCNKLGLPLIERPYRLEDVDVCEPLAANLPRPRDRTQANAYERVHHAVAREMGAGAFVTGNGGDHVFGYSQSAAPIADRYLSEGLGQGTLAALLDVCRQTGCSMVDALRQAWRLARAAPGYRVRPNPLFLEPDFASGLDCSNLHHPWLDAPAGTFPGKAAHIATILRVQPNLDPSGGTRFPVLNPLVSQPIIETCLSVPSWEWRAGGRDRSLARRAFAKDLPPIILDRRVKGTPGRFAARLLDHFRGPIRERVLGGRLAANRIVDVPALEKALAGDRPVADLERVRILEIVNAEAWIDHWASRSQSSEPVEADVSRAGYGSTLSSACPTP
jgi:asparagine synthase (glutamine-hydrolysing)